MNTRLAVDLVKGMLLAPLRKVVPRGVREAVVQTAAKVVSVAHKTNPSGNNMSQR
ncbi:MAG: hypothetical protein V4850_13645 [Myxococcota bacterium]